MKSYSLTYIGIATFVLGWLFEKAGVPFAPADLETTISFIVTTVGVLTSLYGRYRVGDINVFGRRTDGCPKGCTEDY